MSALPHVKLIGWGLGALLLLGCLPATAAPRAAKPTEQTATAAAVDFDKLDAQYARFAAAFYARLAQSGNFAHYKSMDRLDAAVQDLIADNHPEQAVGALLHNLNLLKQNTDSPRIIDFIDILLQNNAIDTADQLHRLIQDEGGKTLQANIAYLYAQYHFERQHWQQTLITLKPITTDLPPERSHHALLMQGIALQKLKHHRPALTLYNKIPATSVYYPAARLNMAVADIRQDWWTDAHVLIHGLLANPQIRSDDDEADRLNTVLGYSFLRQAYFRNAREAFRNVGRNGPYTHQALLGIALAAANQEDYIGALNAVRILKTEQTLDLPVDETYLLMPYFYERLAQNSTASAGYSEAIQYYENRIHSLGELIQFDNATFMQRIGFLTDGTLSLQYNIVDPADKAPAAFLQAYHLLEKLQPLANRLGQQAALTKLRAAYQAALQEVINTALRERIGFLTDYMNQSRYGIARLLDKNETAPQ